MAAAVYGGCPLPERPERMVWDDDVATEAEVCVGHLHIPGNDHPPIMLRPLGVERVVVRIWGPTEESGKVFVEGDLDAVKKKL